MGRAAPDPAAKSPRRPSHPVLALQRSVGNQAVVRMLMRTPSGDKFKTEIDEIHAWLTSGEQKKLVVEGPGLLLLVNEIKGIIDAGRAGWSDIAGKLRELLLGVENVKQGRRVQFGLVGGAGGDLVVGSGKDTQTIQSKYVTASAAATIRANIAKAVYQLSGETGEQPMLAGSRVADVVIEGEAGDEATHDQWVAEKLVRAALDEGTQDNKQVDLWKHVERVVLRSRMHKVVLEVSPGGKLQTYWSLNYQKGEADFPAMHAVGMSNFQKLIDAHSNELPPAVVPVPVQSQPQPQPQPVPQVAPRVQGSPIVKDPNAEKLIGKATTAIPEVIGYLSASGNVFNKADALLLLERALKDEFKGGKFNERDEAASNVDKLLVALQKGYGPIVDLELRFGDPLRRWRKFAKAEQDPREESKAEADDPRLDHLGGETELVRALRQLSADVKWEPAPALAAFRCLITIGALEPPVAADALRDLHRAPLGFEACSVIASNVLWREAKARNYNVVLGALRQVDERRTAVGPILHAHQMWLTEKGDAKGWRLAFEYDEKTPGMWQVTDKHFDMDVGWVLEASPLRIQSLRQVKVASSLSAINDNMKHSIEAGQLSLSAVGDRRLVIFAPTVPSGAYFDAEGEWRTELRRRLKGLDAVGVRMEVVFAGNEVREVPLSQVAKELIDEEAATWTVVSHGRKKGAHA